jgi:hypothetical protein
MDIVGGFLKMLKGNSEHFQWLQKMRYLVVFGAISVKYVSMAIWFPAFFLSP